MSSQHVVLCEGYDDRAFWAGWLEHQGCRDARKFSGDPPLNAWNEEVQGEGKFLYVNRGGSMIQVEPVRGRARVREVALVYLGLHSTKPVGRLVINLDGDVEAGEESTSARDVIDGIAGSRSESGAETVEVQGVVWECANAADTLGVPPMQTLERLVSAAVATAYPGRGGAVADWLDAEPAGGRSHKNYGVSYFAKWYAAEHGYNNFYRTLWRDEAVVAELETRLRAAGAWQTVEALAAD